MKLRRSARTSRWRALAIATAPRCPRLPDGLPVGEVPVDAVTLMRSHLGHGPARYEALAEFPLRMPVAAGAPA